MQPDTSTTGATSSAMRVARASKARPEPRRQRHRGAGVPRRRHVGMQGHRPHHRHTDLGGEALPAAGTE